MSKISSRPLVTEATPLMKLPTGEAGDKTLNVRQIMQFVDSVLEVDTSGDIDLNFDDKVHPMFISSEAIDANAVVDFINDTLAWSFKWAIQFTGTPTLTFPAEVIMNDVRFAAGVFTPVEEGKYLVTGFYDGTDWYVEISQSPYA